MKVFITLFITIFTLSVLSAQTLGIGTDIPAASLDVAGDIALREGVAITVSGVDPTLVIPLSSALSEHSFYRITGTPTGNIQLNSIANGVDGQIITLVNATNINLNLTNNNVVGGILTPGTLAQNISSNGAVTLQYSNQVGRWFIINGTGSIITDWTIATTLDDPAIKTDNQYVTGNVGIGDFSASSPSAPLTVGNGTDGAAYVRVYRNNSPHIQLIEGTDLSTSSTARIQGRVVGTHPQLQITSANGATSWLNVNHDDGNVGIGTTSPLNKLHITDNTSVGIGFSANNGSGTGTPTQARILVEDNNWSADMLFETSVPGSSLGALTERMRLKNTGDLQMTGSQGELWIETNGWSDPGTTGAGLSVDNNSYKSLMIVGNNVAGNLGQNRQVQVWDYLKVNGYVTVGTQTDATATAPPSGTMRYNTIRNCMEYWDGSYWICMGAPTVQRVTVRDQNDENYQGTGCNGCSGWGGSYGVQYPFTVNNLYAGQKVMFYAEIMFDNDTKKNGGFLNATKIAGNGYWGEVEVTVPGGWETVQTKVFPAQQITSSGNLTFIFESNTGISDVRITAVAY